MSIQPATPASGQLSSDVTTLVVRPTKSAGLAAVLGFFLGPLGMLYSTIFGALLMAVVWIVVAVLTLGLGLFIVHPICAVWGALAAQSYNKKQFIRAITPTASAVVTSAPAMYRSCPHCKEQMRRDASVCPHCRNSSAAWTLHNGRWWFRANENDSWQWFDEQNNRWLKHEPSAAASTEPPAAAPPTTGA